jgi:LmbE family N-acetylglucosaminyl deacetylase
LATQGNEVFVSWTHCNPVRESEARAAAHLLGVDLGKIHFFGAPDQGVAADMPQLLRQYRWWMNDVKPDRVCCGAFEQGHIDHDATNLLVNKSIDGPILEIPFYHTYLTRFQRLNRFASPEGQEILDLDLDEQRLKTHIARQFPSQNIWSVLLWYEVYQRARLRPMELAKSERMRLQVHKDFLKPNLPPRLAARVMRSPTWRGWEQAVLDLAPELVKSPVVAL